jgi:hypothetical protein
MPPPLSVAKPTRFAMLACALGVGSIVASCNSDSSGPTGGCLSKVSIAVVITVRDSISGDPAADGTLGILTGAGVDDTLINSDPLTLLGGDKTGTYTVTIDKPGYLTWSASDVHVTEVGECANVIPVDLSAKLQPAPP